MHKGTIAIIIARMTSSRLPGKQLRLIAGKPMIHHIITRLKKVSGLDKIVLATASKKENQELSEYVTGFGIPAFFDSDENDVTGRIARVANRFEAKYIVTVSGDCPLIHPPSLEEGIQLLTKNYADYVFHNKKKYECLHEGFDFYSNMLWQELAKHSTSVSQKEHPGSALPEVKSRFKGIEIIPEKQFQRKDFRISVDTLSDLDFMNTIFTECQNEDDIVDLNDVVRLIDEKPHLKSINSHVHQKTITEQSKKVTIVTHADEKVGMGHLARCIAIANELKEVQAIHVDFCVNDNNDASELLEKQGFKAEVWGSVDELSGKLASNVKRVDGALIDLKAPYLEALLDKTGRLDTRPILVDYVPKDASLGDLFVVPSVAIERDAVSYFAKNKTLTGKSHLLLNRKIRWQRENKTERKGILVTAGGSGILSDDWFAVLAGLSQKNPIRFLAGPFANSEFYHKKAEANLIKNYEVIFNPDDVFGLYNNSKLALSTFGVTTYELIALGVPTAVIKVLNESDAKLVEYLTENDVCLNMLGKKEKNTLIANLSNLLGNQSRLDSLSEKSQAFIDGLGVQRVGMAIKELID